MRYIYILQCCDGTFYVGITTDLKRRITEHNTSSIGAKYTKSRRPVQLVRSEQATTRAEASKKELYLKSLSKIKKQELIAK